MQGAKKMNIYMDNSATTKTDKEVVKAMLPYFSEKYGNASSLHQFGRDAKEALENARSIIAKKINAEPEEIIFTSGGSESDNLAIKGVAYANRNKGNHIITSSIEHHAVLETCKELEKEGFTVSYIGVDKDGIVDLDGLKKAIADKTILITIMHANNEIGTIEPIEEIGRIAKEKGIYFHSDAVQSFTKVPIDVKKINIDLMSFSAHKIHGPKGIGVLYIKKGAKIKRLIDGGSHEFKKRAGTENVPGAVGFAKSVEIAKAEDIVNMAKLRDKLIEGLLRIPNSQLNGPKGSKRLCNNVNIIFNFIEGESMLLHLDMKGVAVSTGSACSSQSLEPSHVLTAIGLKKAVAHGSLRFSLSKYNAEKEIDYVLKVVPKIVEDLRKISPLTKGEC